MIVIRPTRSRAVWNVVLSAIPVDARESDRQDQREADRFASEEGVALDAIAARVPRTSAMAVAPRGGEDRVHERPRIAEFPAASPNQLRVKRSRVAMPVTYSR